MATFAPNSRKYLVMALPRPLPPPVTTITLFSRALSRSIFAEKSIVELINYSVKIVIIVNKKTGLEALPIQLISINFKRMNFIF